MSDSLPISQPSNPVLRRRGDMSALVDRGRRSIRSRLVFWVPAALVFFAVWASYANFRFATFTSEFLQEEHDLVREVGGPNRARQVAFPLMAGVGFVLLLLKRRPVRLHSLPAISAIAFLTMVGASVLWSTETDITIRRVGVVYFVAIAAIGISRIWTPTDLCRAAFMISSVFVGVSIGAEIAAGTFLGGAGYRFSGIFHPNRQSLCTGVLTLASLCLFHQYGRYRYLLIAILGFAMTDLTGSRGGLLSLAFAIAMVYWSTASLKSRLWCVIGCGISAAMVMVLLSLSDRPVPTLNEIAWMGRNGEVSPDALNGRLVIWQECIGDIMERPLLGYGYGAFWTADRVFQYSHLLDWAFASAHSVYFETALDLGVVGLMIVLLMALSGLLAAHCDFKRTRDWGMAFILGLICIALSNGLVEAACVKPGLVTILLSIGLAMLSQSPDRRLVARRMEIPSAPFSNAQATGVGR